MRFSLINVSEKKDGLVRGVWVENCCTGLDVAAARAKATEEVNSNRIEVAVVEEFSGWLTPWFAKRYDEPRAAFIE